MSIIEGSKSKMYDSKRYGDYDDDGYDGYYDDLC